MYYFDRYHRLSEMSFPCTDRVYFDWLAHEYHDIPTRQKLLDIAYMLLHGYDVRDFIHNTYKSREYVNEENVRTSIFMHMAELWETDEDKVEQMYINKNLDAIIDDFFSVLKRYYHVPNDIFKPHYIKDPQMLTESELKEKNPWRNVAKKYKGNSFLFSDTDIYVCDEDKKIIEEFNKKANEDNKYHLNIPAYPWYGNPLKANVIILSMNPGWNEKQDIISKVLLETRTSIVEGFAIHLRSMLDFDCVGMLPNNTCNGVLGVSARDIANLHQLWYWEDRLVREFASDELSIDEIERKCAIIQYVPYSSKKHTMKFKPIDNGTLYSQKYMKELIGYILQHRKDTVFIVPRNVKRWQVFLGDLWDNNRFFVGQNYGSQSLKIQNKDKDKVIQAFKQPIK